MRNYDLEFLKRFSMVIGFLALLTLGLILGAMYLHGTLPGEVDPKTAARTEARIAPAGAVYAGATGAAAQQAAAAAAAASAASQVAYGGTTDGAVIFDNLCAGCHKSGALASLSGEPNRSSYSIKVAITLDVVLRGSIILTVLPAMSYWE